MVVIELMIYILGVDHFEVQLPHLKNDSRKVSQFLGQVRNICREKKIALIAEEISEDGLLSHQIDFTNVGTIVSELGLEYLFCDPGQSERNRLGIKQREDIALELSIRFPYTQAQEDKINEVAAESDRKREKYWLDRIKSRGGANKEVLLICGFGHANYCVEMARKEGFVAQKIS